MSSLFTIMVGQNKNVVGVNLGHITRLTKIMRRRGIRR